MSDADTIREVLSVWGQDTLEMDGYRGPDAHAAEAALASLESQNQALQERIDRTLEALNARSPFFVELRELLSPTQETDR